MLNCSVTYNKYNDYDLKLSKLFTAEYDYCKNLAKPKSETPVWYWPLYWINKTCKKQPVYLVAFFDWNVLFHFRWTPRDSRLHLTSKKVTNRSLSQDSCVLRLCDEWQAEEVANQWKPAWILAVSLENMCWRTECLQRV